MATSEQGQMFNLLLLALKLTIIPWPVFSEEIAGFNRFLKTLEMEHKIYSYIPVVAGWLEVPPESATKALQVLSPDASDGMDHTVEMVFQRSDSGDEQQPWVLVFETGATNSDGGSNHYFKSDLSGKLIFAKAISGKIDKTGKAIKGTGKLEPLDMSSAEVKEKFQHELDFWLKGAYRKKKTAVATPKSPESAKPVEKKQ